MIEYDETWLYTLIITTRGSVSRQGCWFAVPAAIMAFCMVLIDQIDPEFREHSGLRDLNASQLWSASTGLLLSLLFFRGNRAMARFWEGTGLLHQMRGEWFDSVSCCVTFTNSAVKKKPKQVEEFRHIIVRVMSLCHGSALEEIACQESGTLDTIDPYGLSNGTLEHLRDCTAIHGFNRVEVLLHFIQVLITVGLENGTLQIPPPILSRVYETLSRGFVNLCNAKKIADTRFPFPFAQLIAYFLYVNMFVTPLVMSSIFTSLWTAPLFSFIPLFGMASLNAIGTELENPFGHDDNDLPMEHFQTEMNLCLAMLLHWKADLLPSLSDARCARDFGELEVMLKDTYDHHDGEHHEVPEGAKCPTRLDLSGFSSSAADTVSRLSRVSLAGRPRNSQKIPSADVVVPVAPPAAVPVAAPTPAAAPPPPPAAAPPPPPKEAKETKTSDAEPVVAKSIDELKRMLNGMLTTFHASRATTADAMTAQLNDAAQIYMQTSQNLQEVLDRLKHSSNAQKQSSFWG
eukprot:TRINITY_DN7055_c0_g5_i1.p1 TRINITY_DN7055_c0_g5~~TRINITY_DN7055_c0_g5_i1.p1  ORF type:complete len:516 (+),score=66.76 TRINITY_DN7055_c0_g5_i1:105-1652(+)